MAGFGLFWIIPVICDISAERQSVGKLGERGIALLDSKTKAVQCYTDYSDHRSSLHWDFQPEIIDLDITLSCGHRTLGAVTYLP